ncbi:MAG: sce7726 family protein [Lachnospiraceae bacterium]|nr:sce7726 family protein [Lachnospiraceae bacterium]
MEVKKKRDGSLKVLLKDEDIRPVLFEYLEARTPVVRFFEELVLGRSRADAVMISSSEETPSGYAITGFEIKSDKDQLNRLERQSRNYSHYCDFNYLVTGEKYSDAAAEEIPESWGIFLVRAEAKAEEEAAPQFYVELIRPAKPTPRLRLTTQMKLLWRTELTSVIRANKLGGVSGKNKMKLAGLIIDKLGKDEAHRQMCLQLLDRDYTIFDTPATKSEAKSKSDGDSKSKSAGDAKSTEAGEKKSKTKKKETKAKKKSEPKEKAVETKSKEPEVKEKKPKEKATKPSSAKTTTDKTSASKKSSTKKTSTKQSKSGNEKLTIIISQ